MKFSLLSLSAVVALTCLVSPSLVSALPAAPSVATFNQHRVVRVQIQNEAQLKVLTDNENALNFDYFTHNKNVGGNIDIRLAPQDFAKFQALALPYTTLINNLQTVLDQEKREAVQAERQWKLKVNGGQKSIALAGGEVASDVFLQADTWFQSYHSYADHGTWLQAQISANPSKASAFSAGNSYQGRPQSGIKIGNGPNHVVFHGTQHAREHITTMVTEYLIDQLLLGTDTRVAGYLSKFTFHIIPIMNPDGFVITQTTNRMHRKNAQVTNGCLGTDPNRNWSFKWNNGGASTNPCAEDYMGPAPFSTPESKNIGNYLKSLPNVAFYIDIHSYSQLWMTPWGYSGTRPSNYAYLNGLAKKGAAALKAVNGVSFTTGDVYNTIYPASGSAVDFAQSVGVKAPFTIELRDKGTYGFSLPANQILPSGKETWAGIAAVLDALVV